MDLDSDVASSKRLKSSEGQDMISKLPEFIIAHILSLVPIEDAVGTCVLSKTWINLWKFITHLHFREREHTYNILEYMKEKQEKQRRFLNLVNGVMLNRNDSCIQKFTLIINQWYSPYYINEWISAALRRRVKVLHVESYGFGVNLPSYSIIQFKSLEEFVLKVYSCTIRVPSFVCFSSLTVLKLSKIVFLHDHESSDDSQNLILKFPVLREFETRDCTWFGVNSVTLEVPLLEVAYISSYVNNSYKIKFCASRLTKFTYNGRVLPAHPFFSDLSEANITSADIRLLTHCNFNDVEEFEWIQHNLLNILEESMIPACKLLKQFISNVESLKFRWVDLMVEVPQLAKYSLADLPVSKMLTHLEIDSVSVEFLLGLLLKTPMLKTLVFEVLFEFDQDLLNSAIVPDCIRSNLEVVEFSCHANGSEHVLSFAKFVMENAQVLKVMRVHPNSSNSEDVIEKIVSFEKACSVAIIEFHLYGFMSEDTVFP